MRVRMRAQVRLSGAGAGHGSCREIRGQPARVEHSSCLHLGRTIGTQRETRFRKQQRVRMPQDRMLLNGPRRWQVRGGAVITLLAPTVREVTFSWPGKGSGAAGGGGAGAAGALQNGHGALDLEFPLIRVDGAGAMLVGGQPVGAAALEPPRAVLTNLA